MIFLLVLCLTLTTLPQAKLTCLIHQHQIKAGWCGSPHCRKTKSRTGQTIKHFQVKVSVPLVSLMLLIYSPYVILNIVLAVVQSNDEHFKAAFNITHTILFMNSLTVNYWRINRAGNCQRCLNFKLKKHIKFRDPEQMSKCMTRLASSPVCFQLFQRWPHLWSLDMMLVDWPHLIVFERKSPFDCVSIGSLRSCTIKHEKYTSNNDAPMN